MSVQFVTPAKPESTAGAYRVRAKAVSAEYLAGPGSLRVQHLMYLFNCSRSTVFKRLERGCIPAPTGHDPRPYWSTEVIRQHLGFGGATQLIAQKGGQS